MQEVCLTSNRQTMPFLEGDVRRHAFAKMLDAGLAVTLNTDNRTVSGVTVTDELRTAVDAFELSPPQLRNIVSAGFERAFFHRGYLAKQQFVREQMAYYDQLAAVAETADDS